MIRLGDVTFGSHLFLEVIGISDNLDRRHTALTEFTLDGVAAFKGCVEAGDWIEHGRTPCSDCVQLISGFT